MGCVLNIEHMMSLLTKAALNLLWQVRELNNESLHLSATYPGANAQVITQGMEEVHLQWEALQAASLARKKKLRASIELQRFLGSVSDEGSVVGQGRACRYVYMYTCTHVHVHVHVYMVY